MFKKLLMGLASPQIEYEILPVHLPETEKLPTPERITLYHPQYDVHRIPSTLGIGDAVKTGEKLSLYSDQSDYVISPVTGKIISLSPFSGDFGKNYIAITILSDASEIFDDTFRQQIQSPTMEVVSNYLAGAPGNPPLSLLAKSNGSIQTVVIRGLDTDPMVATSQYIAQARFKDLKKGIQILKDVTGIQDFILITAGETMQGYGHIGARVKSVKSTYPSALPHMVMKDVLGQVVPAGKTCEDLGVCFINAEAVIAIGSAFETGQIPTSKIFTFIKKDGSRKIVEAPIGTPIGDILEAYHETANEFDRISLCTGASGSAGYGFHHRDRSGSRGLCFGLSLYQLR